MIAWPRKICSQNITDKTDMSIDGLTAQEEANIVHAETIFANPEAYLSQEEVLKAAA